MTGFMYTLDIASQTDSGKDQFGESEGVHIVVDQKSLLYLMGTVLDYQDTEKGSGFVFNNPNAK